jgi:hypothetical protein
MESNRPSGGLLRPAGFEDRVAIRLAKRECVALKRSRKPLGAFSVPRGFESLLSASERIACTQADLPLGLSAPAEKSPTCAGRKLPHLTA